MSGKKYEFIDHAGNLVKNLSNLHQNGEFADITFIIEKQRISAHRCILVSRSSYFRGLLFGGFAESNKNEIELDVKLAPFKILMEYIYAGSISVVNYEDDLLVDTLSLANEYGCLEFVSCLIKILCKRLTLDNVFLITNTAQLHGFDGVLKICLDFIDANATSLLTHESFKFLSKELLSQIILRDSFLADEVDIFKAILVWSNGQTKEDLAIVLQHVRFTLMQIEELQNVVKPSSLLTTEKIDSIINEIETRIDLPLRCGKKHRLEMECYAYNMKTHSHKPNILFNKPLLFQLSRWQMINHIKMMGCAGNFSYYIEVSYDCKKWTRIVDYSKYICHSTQHLYFDPISVRYIYINPVFRSNPNIGCSLRLLIQNLVPKIVNGFFVAPSCCLQSSKICDETSYNVIIKQNSCTIKLSQPFYIDSFETKGLDDYCVTSIETTADGTNFKKLEKFRRSSKIISFHFFEAHIVSKMKIVFGGDSSKIENKRLRVHVHCINNK